MEDKIKKLSLPLPIENIDFRVQSINKGGYATILAYKDARVDMQRLDDFVGATNWKRQHTRDNKNCVVSIWDETKSEWVSKEDTGTESMTEKEKGLASDSFKRACFNWGIGRELYSYPVISVKLVEKEEYTIIDGKAKATFNLKIKEWQWESEFDSNNNVVLLRGVDNHGKERFIFKAKDSLDENHEKWKDVFKYMSTGGDIGKVTVKYKVSDEIKKRLENAKEEMKLA